MGKVDIKLNSRNIERHILKGRATEADLLRRAQRIAEAAGPGMEVNTNIGPSRARASVVTATSAAMRAEASDRALTRAIDAGR
jgi:hypothetical protein